MASVTKKDIPEVSEFMTAFWGLIKKYYIPEDPDSRYWDDLVQEVNDLYKKYPDELTKKLLLAFVDYEDAKMPKR